MRRPNGIRIPLRGVKVPEERWQAFKEVAASDYITASEAINRLVRAFNDGNIELHGFEVDRGEKPSKNPLHSVRVSDDRWDAFKERAAGQDMTISDAMNRLIEGYVSGDFEALKYPLP